MPKPVTREPLCAVKGCPAPSDPDFHVPICGHGLEGHHHHVVKRSQGGTEGVQVFICPKCHDLADNKPGYGNAVIEEPNGRQTYRLWRIDGSETGKTLIERVISPSMDRSDGAEARPGESDGLLIPAGKILLKESDRREVMPDDPSLLSERHMPEVRTDGGQPYALRVVEGREQGATYISLSDITHLPLLLESLRTRQEDELAALSQQAHSDATRAYLRHTAVVYTLRERYRGQGWDEAAGKLLGYASSTMRRDALFCERLLERLSEATPVEAELIAEVTDRQLRVVARATDFSRALDEAVAYRAETNRAEPEGLAGRLKAEGLLPEPKSHLVCADCGSTNIRRVTA